MGLLARPGGDPLSHRSNGSTLGAAEFHGRVRNGVGWGLRAVTTRSGEEPWHGQARRTACRPAPAAHLPAAIMMPAGSFPHRGNGGVTTGRAPSSDLSFDRLMDMGWRTPTRIPRRPRRLAGGGWRVQGPTPDGVGSSPEHALGAARALRALGAERGRAFAFERLGPVSCTHCCASTSGLSTWWSTTALVTRPGFEEGFPLRCLQRLSLPNVATRRCGWRHNRSTRGSSTPVLSY